MRGTSDGLQNDPASSVGPGAPRGTITVIAGCMFSGKTTELFRRLAEFSLPSILVFKHVIDQRYRADAVVSHDGEEWPAIQIASADEIMDHLRAAIEVIAVDEAHFFDAKLVDVTCGLADRGVTVITTSLDRDSWGRPFAVAKRLCAIADESIVKHAVCAECGVVADRTQRFAPIIDGNMVGGPESYEARCQVCWVPPPTPSPDDTLPKGTAAP